MENSNEVRAEFILFVVSLRDMNGMKEPEFEVLFCTSTYILYLQTLGARFNFSIWAQVL